MRNELAIINRDDYEAFRNIPTRDLPDTYDEWLQLSAQSRLEWGRAGAEIVEIEVHSDEFARFLSATGQPANMKSLWDFVREKIGGNLN